MADLSLLIEPEDLAAQLPLPGTLIIDQSKQEHFLKHHIPGAVWLDFKRLQAGTAPAPGKLPSAEQLSSVFSELGLTPDTHVICCDDEGGGWDGRLIWVLDSIGHTQYSVINGGMTAWLDAGLPVEAGEVTPTPSSYTVTQILPQFTVTKDEILAHLGEPGFAVWDARGPLEYTGEKVVAQRGGHIPGAAHFEWTDGMDKSRALRMRDLNDLKAELQSLGLDSGKQIVTHCHTHHRSGYTYLIGKLLGFDIRGYAGSWSEWNSDPDTPVTTGPQA